MATDLTTTAGRAAFIKTAANPDNKPLVHTDPVRAQTILAMLSEARKEPGNWTQASASAFADAVGRGEHAEVHKASKGTYPVDSRGWPIVAIHGRCISLDPAHDCHTTKKAPRFY